MRAPLAAIAALIMATAACGSATPSRELVNARQAYDRASRARAAEYTPASVLSARQALQRAEREHAEDPGSAEERSYAYVAQRRAELAMVEGEAAYQRAEKQRAEAEYAQLRQELSQRTEQELEASRERLETLEQEAADTRRQLEELQALGAIKQDERGTVLTLSGQVLFQTGKADLMPAAKESLTQVARVLAKGTQPITVEGHTDSRGSKESNQVLSMQRAQAVRNFLISQGVSPDRITAVGMGESQAVASNETSEGRANNRRVEIVLGPPAGERLTPAAGKRPQHKHREGKQPQQPQQPPQEQQQQPPKP